MSKIPTQSENPKGFHARYYIQKVVKNPNYGIKEMDIFCEERDDTEFILKPTDEGSEYFVMRLDTGGSDLKHIEACRIAINAYADAIYPYLPELATDLKIRYPLL